MAVVRGGAGTLSIDGDTIAQLTSYTIDTVQDTAEASHMDSNTKEYVHTTSSWSGSGEFIFVGDSGGDSQAVAASALDLCKTTADGNVALVLLPEGAGAGNSKMAGNIIVTGYSVTGGVDNIVSGSFSFQGTGELAYTPATA